jgi:DHA3 family tetracycline resistance protein-like MFS transporter
MRFRHELAAATVYIAMEASTGLFFYLMATVASFYRIVVAGLDPLQLVLVGTVLEATTFLCEVPTGVLADAVSRRASIIVGIFLTGAGFMLEGSIPEFPAIIGAQILWGTGFTFISGADVAWITDEVGERRAGRLYLLAGQVGQITALVGIFASVALASLSLRLPIVLAGAAHVLLGMFLLVAMPETRVRARAEAGARYGRRMLAIFGTSIGSVRGRPVLLLVLGVSFLYGISNEGFDRLWVLHLLQSTSLPSLAGLDRVVSLGVINAGGLLLAILGTEVVKRRVDTSTSDGAARALALITVLLVGGVVSFGFAESFPIAVGALWAVTLVRELIWPLYAAWLNQGLDPATRATVNSIGSQVGALGEIVGGPALGVLATVRSVQAAIVAAGLLRAPTLLLFARARRLEPGRAAAD